MDIVWREVAIDGLERARSYIARHNPAAAERIRQTILVAVERLADRPNLGRPGRVEGTRELVVPNTRYIVAYTVVDDKVAIVAVQHTAQQWPDQF
jgi:toxin ParE1/3/4